MNSIIHAVEMFSKTIPPDSTVLDVGCGLRPYERFFTHGQYIGIDVESSGRESTGKRADHIFDGTHIPFETNSLDAIICTEVLEHAVDPEKLLDEMHRVLKPNARLLITVPFIWGLHELPYDFRRYTYEGIKKIITNAGFIIEKQQNLNSGVNAIQTLVLSEINNYQKNVLSAQERKTLKFRLINWLQRKLFLLVVSLWSRIYKFERVYIDNMVIAKKRLIMFDKHLHHGISKEVKITINVIQPPLFNNFCDKRSLKQRLFLFARHIKVSLKKVLIK